MKTTTTTSSFLVLLATIVFCRESQSMIRDKLFVHGFVVVGVNGPFQQCCRSFTSTPTVTSTQTLQCRQLLQYSYSSLPSNANNNNNNNKNGRQRLCRRQNSFPLFAQSNDDEYNDDGSDDSSLTSPLDRFLTLVASDSFSIVAGTLGLLAVVAHRWNLVLAMTATAGDDAAAVSAAAEALSYQTRTDLLGVFASGSVLLNGVTKLDVTTALAESVVLEGTVLAEPELYLNSSSSAINDNKNTNENTNTNDSNTISWALKSLLAATPAKTAVLVTTSDDDDEYWTVRCRAGVVPSTASNIATRVLAQKTPILDRVGSPENSKETYLPTLQALPGRTELNYLPSNTQMAVLIPMKSKSNGNGRNSVLVLGANTAKSFTPRDIAWSRIVAERIGDHL